MPEVSVCIPNYNYGRFLADAIASALAQMDVDLEVVVCDNASTDESLEVARGFEVDPRVRIEAYPRTVDMVSSLNRSIAQARAPFVVLLHADDCLRPGFLASTLPWLRENAAVAVVHTAVEYMDEQGDVVGQQPIGAAAVRVPSAAMFEQLLLGNFIHTSSALVRREALGEERPFDPEAPYVSDWNLWLRLARRWDFAYVPDRLAAYRVHAANETHRYLQLGLLALDHLKVLRRILGTLPAEHQVSRQAVPRAYRALALGMVWIAADRLAAGDVRLARYHLRLARVASPGVVFGRRYLPVWALCALGRLGGRLLRRFRFRGEAVSAAGTVRWSAVERRADAWRR